MYEVLKAGGFTNGGLNFDSKARRASNTMEDIFLSYIAGMDTFALGLRKAAEIIKDARLDKFIETKYASYKKGIGQKIVQNKIDLMGLYEYSKDLKIANIVVPSGHQENLEQIVNDILFK
jgi:xylose isomerase